MDSFFKYCPRCKSNLTIDEQLLRCSSCQFHFYVNPSPCTAVILTNSKGEILLVERKFDPKKGFWDLAGGFFDYDESAEESVMREIGEELGVTASNISYFGSWSDRYEYKGFMYHSVSLVFTGELNQQTLHPADDVARAAWFAKSDLPYERIAFESLKKALKSYIKF